jgi:galactokinase
VSKPVYCYIILCDDQSFYTGWTKNIKARFKTHLAGKGSKYTRIHKPKKVIYWESCANISVALKRELKIKKMNKKQKNNFMTGWESQMNLPKEFENYEYLSIAPGRVNLIGEHIDYNGGPVLPAAIDRYVYLGANKSTSAELLIKSLDFDQTVTLSLPTIEKKIDINGNPLPDWALYPAGVIWVAKENNLEIGSFQSIFTSSIPIGAGLSSSAAVEVAFAALLREFNHWNIDNMELAKICQTAENDYIGVNCGLMDQFASANGIKKSALYFDTSNLEWFPVDLPEEIALVITNSKLPRSLSSSEYNLRRKSCETALKTIQESFPTKKYLSELSIKEFEEIRNELFPLDAKRVQHVVHETNRVKLSIESLKTNDINNFGKLMVESHQSLKDLYEVSTPELDLIVSTAIKLKGCYGSRLTGAGFGGCVISLVDRKHVKEFVKNLEQEYFKTTQIKAETYICEASDGVSVRWHDNKFSLD